jgi:hypothetical protein
MKKKPKVGDLCRILNLRSHDANNHRYYLFDTRPLLQEDGTWTTPKYKRIGSVLSNKDMFVLLEITGVNHYQYPKVLTINGLVGYLYLHNDNEGLEKVEQ